MSYTKKEILDALRVIRSVCKITRDGGSCEGCELFNEDYGQCGLECQLPRDWYIVEDDAPWRAFR